MISRWSFSLLLFLIPTGASADAPGTSAPHVRTTDDTLRAAIARGIALSGTFRHLVDRIEASDVIVYVIRRPRVGRSHGVTQFITATVHRRYLRITLEADEASDETVGLLGHELRHVVEAVDAPQVRNESSYEALYRRIGRASCGAPSWCFDTTEAVAAGHHVYGELRAGKRRTTRLTEQRD